MYRLEDLKKLKKEADRATYEFEVGRNKWVLIHYKEGHRGGHHYHKGISPIKNPEVLVLIDGKIELTLRDMKTGKEEKVIADSPKIIKINPYVYHEALALEESFFLELGEDGYPKDKFDLEKSKR